MHPISNNIFQRQSANSSLSSPCLPKIDDFSHSPLKQRTEGNTENSIRRLRNDDITFVERMASQSSFRRVVLPSRRQRAVTALPPVDFDVEDRHLNNIFDREFLKITLGKSLIDRSVLPFFIFVTLLLTSDSASIFIHQERRSPLHTYALHLTIILGVRQEPGTMVLYLLALGRIKIVIILMPSEIFSLDSRRL